MLNLDPVSLGPIDGVTSPAVLAVRIARRLRTAQTWQEEVEDALAMLGLGLGLHRTILFRWKEIPGKGFAQSVAGLWAHEIIRRETPRPTIIDQTNVFTDPGLLRLTEDMRRGRVFSGHTHDLDGFLRTDFETQRIKSFLSVPIFTHGHLWGDLAVNDCETLRDWTPDERAAVEVVAWAIGDAVERSQSEQHVSDIYRSTVLHASLDAVIVSDEVGGIIEFNPAAERIFGWSKADILGRNILQAIVPPEHAESCGAGMRNYIEGSFPVMMGRRTESHAVNAAGETFPVELTISEVNVADRRLFVASIRDMRDQRAAEAEIDRQREKLHQNEKMAAMGSLLAGVSHELNNPLAVVVAQSTLLHEFATDPQIKARAEKVRAAAERCGRIVKSFLGMVRLHPSAQSETDINRVVRSALEVTAYGARSAGIQVVAEFHPGTLSVLADSDHLTQVAANFLVNSHHALAATPGEKRIRVFTFYRDGTVGFAVEDNGPGIPEPIRQRIFEPYFTTKPVGVGTGIGLSISKSIVERHNGRIRFEEAEPSGARFVVELPAMKGTVPGAELGPQSIARTHDALIIDDEPDVASALSDILELMGVSSTVLTAWPPPPGYFETVVPDIVFSDLRMPGFSGLAIYRDLLDRRPDLAGRFVLVTGDMIGARAELELMPPGRRPLLLEKPFSTLDVRSALATVSERATPGR